MIQTLTFLRAADNSGAQVVQCIRVLGGYRKRYARVGDRIVVAIKQAKPRGKVKKGSVSLAVVVRTKKLFGENAAVLLNHKGEPVGTRIFGPVGRMENQSKILSLAPAIF